MEKMYVKPTTDIVNVGASVEVLAGLDMNISDGTTVGPDDLGAKTNYDFDEEDDNQDSNIWTKEE